MLVEKYPPQLPPDPYARQPARPESLSGKLPSQRAPATHPCADRYAAQRRATFDSSSRNHHAVVPLVSPAATPFVPSAAAVDNDNNEFSVVRLFLEDTEVIRSDELTMAHTELLYFVKGRMR